MTDLSDLIRRVEEAKGPDRHIDAAITVATSPTIATDDDLIYFYVPTKDDRCAPGTYWRKSRSFSSLHTAAPFTASLDAALALVEEKLPGCRWTKNIEGEIWLWHGDWSTSSHRCANDALTCLFALLHALHSQSDSERSPPLKDGG